MVARIYLFIYGSLKSFLSRDGELSYPSNDKFRWPIPAITPYICSNCGHIEFFVAKEVINSHRAGVEQEKNKKTKKDEIQKKIDIVNKEIDTLSKIIEDENQTVKSVKEAKEKLIKANEKLKDLKNEYDLVDRQFSNGTGNGSGGGTVATGE